MLKGKMSIKTIFLKLCVYNEKNEVLINVYKRIGLPL